MIEKKHAALIKVLSFLSIFLFAYLLFVFVQVLIISDKNPFFVITFLSILISPIVLFFLLRIEKYNFNIKLLFFLLMLSAIICLFIELIFRQQSGSEVQGKIFYLFTTITYPYIQEHESFFNEVTAHIIHILPYFMIFTSLIFADIIGIAAIIKQKTEDKIYYDRRYLFIGLMYLVGIVVLFFNLRITYLLLKLDIASELVLALMVVSLMSLPFIIFLLITNIRLMKRNDVRKYVKIPSFVLVLLIIFIMIFNTSLMAMPYWIWGRVFSNFFNNIL